MIDLTSSSSASSDNSQSISPVNSIDLVSPDLSTRSSSPLRTDIVEEGDLSENLISPPKRSIVTLIHDDNSLSREEREINALITEQLQRFVDLDIKYPAFGMDMTDILRQLERELR